MAPKKKKTKAAVNPARGFATVSVPSTKVKEEQPESHDENNTKHDIANTTSQTSTPQSSSVSLKNGPVTSTDTMTPDQLERHLDLSEIRIAVEKHGPKVKRDVARQCKTLETDRRLLRLQSTPLTALPEHSIDKAMELIRLDPSYSDLPLSQPIPSSGLTLEMDLSLKLWTLYETLKGLNLPNIEAVIKHLLSATVIKPNTAPLSRDTIWGLEEALYWYAINEDEKSLPQFERSQTLYVPNHEDNDAENESEATTITRQPLSRQIASPSSKSSSTVLTPAEVSDASSSDGDGNGEPVSVFQYLELQARLLSLQDSDEVILSKDGNLPNVTRQIGQLLSRIARITRDPLFDRKEAESQWIIRKRVLEIENAKAKAEKRRERARSEQDSVADPTLEGGNQSAADDLEMLSGLFKLGDNLPNVESEPGTQVTIRDFGKWSGVNPRRVLEDACKGRDPGSRVRFEKISNSFHAHRYRVEVRWSKDSLQSFPGEMLIPEVLCEQKRRLTSCTMQTIATSSPAQSEAYISTVLLFILFAGLQQGERPNIRLPTVWRHFWTDLSERMDQYVFEQDAKRLEELRSLVRESLPSLERKESSTSILPFSKQTESNAEVLTLKTPLQPRSSIIQNIWTNKLSSPAYEKMLRSREQLPVYKQKSELLQVFNSHQLMILCGETGSGKSTQTPALILEHELSSGKDCKILCTQPRRISAMSLAARVSEELGENKGDLGTTRSLVGYAIRLESKVSASTRLTYATTGVAMRLLERQDDLADVNVLVVDEVHERNIDSDFLLIVLKRLLSRRPDLKVVLMSATIDADRFSSYLNGCPILTVPGRTFPVQTLFLEDAIESTNTVNFEQTMGMADYEDNYNDDDVDLSDAHSRLQNLQGYSERTISILRRINEYKIDFGFITKVLISISTRPDLVQYSKAILIFMPGIGEMRRLHQVITSYPAFQHGWIFHILHSTVSTEDQQAAFRLPPQGMRKIVIATNIAETGITIPDITAVIDTGKEKIMRFDERRQVSRLTESFISKASSRQRQGRAARVQEGLCVRLYTRDRFDRLMTEHSTPEILRLSLSETILRVKLCALGPIESSLSEALDPPMPKNVRRAIEALKEEKVLTTFEDLTAIGRQLARLPLDIPLGKLVLNGLNLQCLDVMSTVAALLSSKSPFISSVKSTTGMEGSRKSFARGDSDLLLLFTAYEAWRRAETEGNGATFCQKAFLSRQTLSLIEDQKVQLLVHLVDAGLLVLTSEERTSLQASRFRSSKRNFFTMPLRYNLNGANDNIINAAIALSFYPRLLRKEGKGWRNVSTNQNVTLSSQSVNRDIASAARWLSFYQTMQTKFQGLTVSETSRVDDLAVALLIGDADCKLFSGTMTLDSNRIKGSGANTGGIEDL
ncbi:putative atp dependent rna helicase [Phaeomoniella chlamydospora]|uniref:RNA helicase n=1 Tax=Phaeomoniella chlamydospora TaxID=158046 RepID=A0A0G2DVN4_PHACM|nr:putative atp dependent rna helicase [Phaeomoniella chlamydospora]